MNVGHFEFYLSEIQLFNRALYFFLVSIQDVSNSTFLDLSLAINLYQHSKTITTM